MDDDRYLAVCRESGRHGDVIVKLLELGRRAEAVGEAERLKGEPNYLTYCDLLAGGGEAAAAERIVRSRPKWNEDRNALYWLTERAKARRDAAEVLALTERRFDLWPNLTGYQATPGRNSEGRLAGEAGDDPPRSSTAGRTGGC